MKNQGFTSALLVSDPYHMKRSIAMCNLMEIEVLPSPTTMYRTPKTKCMFLFRETFYYWVYTCIGQYRSIV